MKLTKARIDSFQYEGCKLTRGFSRDVRWDDAISGFGVRVYPTGRRAFVLSYRVGGRKRLITLGDYGPITLDQARDKALREKAKVTEGKDPLQGRQDRRQAPTVKNLADDYLERHAGPHKRSKSVRDDRAMLGGVVLPRLRNRKVAAVRRRDIETVHQAMKDTPYRANRVLSLLSKMFSLAVEWEWVERNPVKGVRRFSEEKRERWLSTDELKRLSEALNKSPNQRAANVIRMLLLTGARRSEVMSAEWQEIHFDRGVWTKPSHHAHFGETGHANRFKPAR